MLLAACASVSVDQEGTSIPIPPNAESHLRGWLRHHRRRVGRSTGPGAELADFKHNLQTMLTTGVVTDLADKLGVQASPADDPTSLPPQNAWVVTGEFVRVNQGSRFLRLVIGFGAGGTKVETNVHVYDLQQGYRKRPFLNFVTIGGSGAQPGCWSRWA
ncbi:MAG: DUF4410 domain-containing protein [Verrucomicrobiota bacterium]